MDNPLYDALNRMLDRVDFVVGNKALHVQDYVRIMDALGQGEHFRRVVEEIVR